MFQFIVVNILMLSVGTMLYLVARSLPNVGEEESAAHHGPLGKWIASEIPEKLDLMMNSFMGKSLRKAKVFLLKIDNILTERLKKIRTENGNGKQKIDFNGITGGEKDSDKISAKE